MHEKHAADVKLQRDLVRKTLMSSPKITFILSQTKLYFVYLNKTGPQILAELVQSDYILYTYYNGRQLCGGTYTAELWVY